MLAGERAEPGHRQDEGAQRRDVAYEQDARARREPCRNGVEELVLAERRPRQRGDDDLRAGESRDLVPEDPLGAVLVVGQQDLVASPELDASRHRIEPGRHVRNEPEVVSRRRADVPGDALPDPRQPGGKPAGEEQHRLELELAPQLVLALEDGAWHGTEAAVVEERHLGVEHEQLAKLLGARWHGREGASRLGGERKLHVDLHLGDPDLDVDAERAGMLEALVAEDGQVGLAVQAGRLAAEGLDDERRVREVNDARSLGVSRLEKHARSIAAGSDGVGPAEEGRERRRAGPMAPPLGFVARCRPG